MRKLPCARKLETWAGQGLHQHGQRARPAVAGGSKDADVVVLIRERTHLSRALIEKLPRLKLIAQTGKAGPHIDLAACHDHGVAVAEGVGSPYAAAELTWALVIGGRAPACRSTSRT